MWIFFDCFNTLIDDFDDSGDISGLASSARIAERSGLFSTAEDFVAAYDSARADNWGAPPGEVTFDRRLNDVLRRAGCSAARADDLVREMLVAFDAEYPPTLRPTPGVAAMLDAWAGHAKLGVVSNFFLPDWPERLLEKFGLRHHFEFVLDSAQAGVKKPDPTLYQAALVRAGTTPEHVVFIGDNFVCDVQGPRDFGMKAVHRCRAGQRPGVAPSPDPDPIRDWAAFRPG